MTSEIRPIRVVIRHEHGTTARVFDGAQMFAPSGQQMFNEWAMGSLIAMCFSGYHDALDSREDIKWAVTDFAQDKNGDVIKPVQYIDSKHNLIEIHSVKIEYMTEDDMVALRDGAVYSYNDFPDSIHG